MKFNQMPFRELLTSIIDNRGKTCPTDEVGIPLIATNCVKNTNLYPTYEKARYVSQVTYNTWFRGHPKPDDMIFVTKGSPGQVCWTPTPMNFCIAQDMVAIRADSNKVYPKYLFALLRSDAVQNMIQNMHVGTLIPHFKKGDFDKLILPIPDDKDYQEFVGDTYFRLSEKIELNRQINQTLEQIAQTIFKSWFVDFEPVKAKIAAKHNSQPPERAAMRAISGKSDEELNQLSHEQRQRLAATAALFPDELIDSELGEIPKGWVAKSLGEICSRVVMGPFGSNIKKDNFITSGIPVIRGSNLTAGLVEEGYVFLSEEKADKLCNSNAFPGDIVITHRGTLGQVAIIPENSTYKRYVVSQSQMALTIDKSKASPRFVHEFLNSNAGQHLILANKSQVGVPAIARPTSSIKSIPLVLPTIDLLNSFDDYTQSSYYLAVENIKTNKILAELRDSLLPKFLSGEITINKAEENVEAAAC